MAKPNTNEANKDSSATTAIAVPIPGKKSAAPRAATLSKWQTAGSQMAAAIFPAFDGKIEWIIRPIMDEPNMEPPFLIQIF
jgi:hypothetical protein